MVSTAFVHALDDEYMTESAYEENIRHINAIIADMRLIEHQKNELMRFDIFTEAKEDFYTESFKDAVTNLGERIIKIFTDLKDRIKSLFRNHDETVWKKKNEDQKLEMIARKDPKTAERVKVALERGDLDMNSFKDIKAFFDDCDRVLDDLEKRAIDPKSVRGKWEAAKKKLSDNKDNVKIACTVIGCITATAGFYITYKKYKSGSLENLTKESEYIAKHAEKQSRRIENRLKILKNMEKDAKTPTLECAIIGEMASELSRMETGQVGIRLKLYNKVTKAMSKAFELIADKSGKDTVGIRSKNLSDVMEKNRTEKEKYKTIERTQTNYAGANKSVEKNIHKSKKRKW